MRRFLFDRLCNPELSLPVDAHSKLAHLRASIKEELQRLVSGRSWFDGLQKGHTREKSILNFGIDNPVEYATSAQDNKLLMEQVLEMVKYYEPRLINPQVFLTGNKNPLSPKAIAIVGQIQLADAKEDFSHILSVTGAK